MRNSVVFKFDSNLIKFLIFVSFLYHLDWNQLYLTHIFNHDYFSNTIYSFSSNLHSNSLSLTKYFTASILTPISLINQRENHHLLPHCLHYPIISVLSKRSRSIICIRRRSCPLSPGDPSTLWSHTKIQSLYTTDLDGFMSRMLSAGDDLFTSWISLAPTTF